LVKGDKKEYLICQYSVFYGEYEKEKKTGQKNLTPGIYGLRKKDRKRNR
jgi:hypothetical protein